MLHLALGMKKGSCLIMKYVYSLFVLLNFASVIHAAEKSPDITVEKLITAVETEKFSEVKNVTKGLDDKIAKKALEVIINQTDSKGTAPLHYAAENLSAQAMSDEEKADARIFYYLLDLNGIDVNKQDKHGYTALSFIILWLDGVANLAQRKILLDAMEAIGNAGANPNIKDQDGNNVLSDAISMGHLDALKLFETFTTKPNWTTIYVNAKNGYTPLHYLTIYIGGLEEERINANELDDIPSIEKALKDAKETIKYVISKGIEINKKSIHGKTPLDYVLGSGDKNIIDFMKSKGAQRGDKDSFEITVNLPTSDFRNLIERPEVLEDVNENGDTLLHYLLQAMKKAGTGMMKYEMKLKPLLENIKKLKLSALINTKNKLGNTPLHLAYQIDDAKGTFSKRVNKLVSLLITYGADQTITNNKGEQPKPHFAMRGLQQVLKQLKPKLLVLSKQIKALRASN